MLQLYLMATALRASGLGGAGFRVRVSRLGLRGLGGRGHVGVSGSELWGNRA